MQERSDQLPTSRSRAVRLDSFGGPEVLVIREVPAPQAGPGQVRVRVTAAGLNPMDWASPHGPKRRRGPGPCAEARCCRHGPDFSRRSQGINR